jgi:cellulose synthase/poly-beta-1,6-N-acetylglucosamine synthase-like glycosyltransferase
MTWRWLFGLKLKELTCQPYRKYTITVVIPAYNEEKSIVNTINSIKNQSVAVDSIIVVDDCSTDKTNEVAASQGVKVVQTNKNQGTKAMAQNYVIDMIETDLMVTIDADTTLHKDAIKNTLPYFNDELTASVCGFVIPQKIKTLWERGRFIEYMFGLSIFKSAQMNAGAIMVSSGCFSVFRTKHIKTMGGFQSRTMAEDMDLTWEFLMHGYHIHYAPNAYCYPIDPPTYKIFKSQVERWYRSFFQNIAVHQLRKNKKLGGFIYWYLIDSIIAPVIALALWFYTSNFTAIFLSAILIDLLIVLFICSITGIRIKMIKETLLSIWAFFVIRPVNFYLFWKAFWKEWIVKDRLMVWEKGH